MQYNSWQLSKSSFVKGNQCTKYLYLDKYKKNERTPVDKETQARFDRGHEFEDAVRNTLFPKDINIKEKVGSLFILTPNNRYNKFRR